MVKHLRTEVDEYGPSLIHISSQKFLRNKLNGEHDKYVYNIL